MRLLKDSQNADTRWSSARFPEVVDGALARLGAGIQEANDSRLEVFPNGVEEPAVAVDLFRVLLLEAEDHLNRYEVVRAVKEERSGGELAGKTRARTRWDAAR